MKYGDRMIENVSNFFPPEKNYNLIEYFLFSFEHQMPLAILSWLFLLGTIMFFMLFLMGKGISRITMGVFSFVFLVISLLPHYSIFNAYSYTVNEVHLYETEEYKQKWLFEEVLPNLTYENKREYRVLDIGFVATYINQNGLYWIGELKDEQLCMQGVVLDLENVDGTTFASTGLVQVTPGDDVEESYLTAYYFETDIEGIPPGGLYQGELTIPAETYDYLDCN